MGSRPPFRLVVRARGRARRSPCVIVVHRRACASPRPAPGPGAWIRPVAGAVARPFVAAEVRGTAPATAAPTWSRRAGPRSQAASAGEVTFAGNVGGIAARRRRARRRSADVVLVPRHRRGAARPARRAGRRASAPPAAAAASTRGVAALRAARRRASTSTRWRCSSPPTSPSSSGSRRADSPDQQGFDPPAVESRVARRVAAPPAGRRRRSSRPTSTMALLDGVGAAFADMAGIAGDVDALVGGPARPARRRRGLVLDADRCSRSRSRTSATMGARLARVRPRRAPTAPTTPRSPTSGGGSGHLVMTVAGINSSTDADTASRCSSTRHALGYRDGEVTCVLVRAGRRHAYAKEDTWHRAASDEAHRARRPAPGDAGARTRVARSTSSRTRRAASSSPSSSRSSTTRATPPCRRSAPSSRSRRRIAGRARGRRSRPTIRDVGRRSAPSLDARRRRPAAARSHRRGGDVDASSSPKARASCGGSRQRDAPGPDRPHVDRRDRRRRRAGGPHRRGPALRRSRSTRRARRPQRHRPRPGRARRGALALEMRPLPCVGSPPGVRGAVEPVVISRIEQQAGDDGRTASATASISCSDSDTESSHDLLAGRRPARHRGSPMPNRAAGRAPVAAPSGPGSTRRTALVVVAVAGGVRRRHDDPGRGRRDRGGVGPAGAPGSHIGAQPRSSRPSGRSRSRTGRRRRSLVGGEAIVVAEHHAVSVDAATGAVRWKTSMDEIDVNGERFGEPAARWRVTRSS